MNIEEFVPSPNYDGRDARDYFYDIAIEKSRIFAETSGIDGYAELRSLFSKIELYNILMEEASEPLGRMEYLKYQFIDNKNFLARVNAVARMPLIEEEGEMKFLIPATPEMA